MLIPTQYHSKVRQIALNSLLLTMQNNGLIRVNKLYSQSNGSIKKKLLVLNFFTPKGTFLKL